MNNKNLTIIFVILLAAFAASKIFKGNQNTSFEKVIIHVDTAAVDKIVVHPKGAELEYSILKSNQAWSVSQGGITTTAKSSTVAAMLGTLSNIEIQRLVARSKERWVDYDVDENSGVRIEVYSGKKKLEDFVVGRFNFDQQSRSATSYLRKYWDKTILNLEKERVSQIEIRSGGRTESLNVTQGLWLKSTGERIDSTLMSQYLNGISQLNGSTVTDQLSTSDLAEVASVKVTDGESHQVSIYAKDGGFWLHSSVNNGVYFDSDSTGVYQKLVGDLEDLLWEESGDSVE